MRTGCQNFTYTELSQLHCQRLIILQHVIWCYLLTMTYQVMYYCINTQTHMHTCARTHTHTHTHMIHIHTHNTHTHTHIHDTDTYTEITHIHTPHRQTDIHTHTHTQRDTHTHRHSHTTQTHTHTHSDESCSLIDNIDTIIIITIICQNQQYIYKCPIQTLHI